MNLTWINEKFICKGLYAPFVLQKDCDYLKELKRKYDLILKQANEAGADDQSIKIIAKFRDKILGAIRSYYRADIARCNRIIFNLIKDIGDEKPAAVLLNESYAFPGAGELQLFRCRVGNPSKAYTAKEMLHLPYSMRAKTGNYRFSIPGSPSLYLANSSYGCWIETGYPDENDFNVSPVLLDGTQKIFNLVVMMRDLHSLNDGDEQRVHCWLKLIMLNIATSYRIEEADRSFKSEYIISQAIMMACKKLGFDGVAYYSKRVSDEIFASCATNLALFVDYKGEYSDLINHMKMDNSFNFSLYKKLHKKLDLPKGSDDYGVRSVRTILPANIGNYKRQFPYRETDFYLFDSFLFSTWSSYRKNNKDQIPWGVPVNE